MDVVARGETERGELTLLRRRDGTHELRVNGVFVMDDSETSTERALATAALAAAGRPELDVLVGGLGLGFTLLEVLRDPRVRAVTVAEIEPDLVRWHRAGLICADTPDAPVLDDRRVTVSVGDLRELVRATPEPTYDLILLDLDNGPGYLVYEDNADVYELEFLASCAGVVRPGGALAVWSAESSTSLRAALVSAFDEVWEHIVPVRLQGRNTSYFIYVGRT